MFEDRKKRVNKILQHLLLLWLIFLQALKYFFVLSIFIDLELTHFPENFMQSLEKIKKEVNNLGLNADVKLMLCVDLHFVINDGE